VHTAAEGICETIGCTLCEVRLQLHAGDHSCMDDMIRVVRAIVSLVDMES
jgi:hypothetical protein